MADAPTEIDPKLVHISEVAKLLGLSEYQTKGLVEKGKLPGEKIGNRTYIPARAVVDYIEAIGRASA